MVIYNGSGALGLIVAVAAGVAVGLLFDWGPVGVLVGGFTGTILDLVLRVLFRRRWATHSFWLVASASGGHLWYIPVWILGLLVGGFGIWLVITEMPPPH